MGGGLGQRSAADGRKQGGLLRKTEEKKRKKRKEISGGRGDLERAGAGSQGGMGSFLLGGFGLREGVSFGAGH